MKIVIFLENNRAGGLDAFCINLIQSWPNQTDEFILFCNKSHPGLRYIENSKLTNLKIMPHNIPLSWEISWINSIKNNILRKISLNIVRFILLPYQYIRVKALLKNIKSNNLISLNGGYPGGNTTRMANIAWKSLDKGKSIHAIHGHPSKSTSMFKMLIEKYITKKLFDSATNIVTVSNSCIESIKKIPGYDQSFKIDLIYNGINCKPPLKTTKKLRIRDHVHIPKNSSILLMLGTYDPNKGHSFLFEAMKKVVKDFPDCHLIICGDGNEKEKYTVRRLLEQIPFLEKNVHLLDYIEGASTFMSEADMVLIGSQENESFGLTAIEAMNNSIPIVSTDVGGLKEVIENSVVGYCCDKNSPEIFADKIIYLLKNPRIRKDMGDKGKLHVQNNFDSYRMSIEYQKLLMK